MYIFGPSVSSYPFRWPPLPTHPSQLPIRYCTLEVSQPWRGQLKLCSSPPTSPACPPRHLCYSYLNEWMTTLSKPNKSPGVILDLFPKPPLLSSYQASLVSLLRGLHSHSYCLNYLSLWLVKNLSFPIYPCPTAEHKTWETFLKVWSWPFCLLKAPPWFSMAPPANFLPSPVELFVTSSVPALPLITFLFWALPQPHWTFPLEVPVTLSCWAVIRPSLCCYYCPLGAFVHTLALGTSPAPPLWAKVLSLQEMFSDTATSPPRPPPPAIRVRIFVTCFPQSSVLSLTEHFYCFLISFPLDDSLSYLK